MMALTEKCLSLLREDLAKHLPQPLSRADERIASRGLPAIPRKPAEIIQSLKEELDVHRREHGRLQQAIFEAAQVQRRLCAPRELAWGEFEIAGEIFPVRHLSGDFFKVTELYGALGIAVGDIAGKGLTAGIWLTYLLGLVQCCVRKCGDPALAAAEVNRELCQDSGEPPLTALFLARLDSLGNELTYCNAGLPAPLLLRQNKSVERLEAGGPMLGALQQARFESGSVRFNPGDMLVAYSDGVTECRNPQEQEFEVERLLAAASAAKEASANQALFSTLGAVLDFANASPPGDDLTLLVVRRRNGIPAGLAHSLGKDDSAPLRRPTSILRPKNVGQRGHGSK